MADLNIDLGSELSEVCCPVEQTKDTKKYYPSFHYSGDKPLKLPREGEMVVRFKKVSSEHRIDADNKDKYACTIEIREIVSANSDGDEPPAENRMKESEEALDKLRDEKIRKRKEKSDESEDY